MEPVAVAPVFVAERPILGWLDPVFFTLAQRVHIPALALTADFPPTDCTPELLRAELERRTDDKEPTDDLWTAVIAQARQPGEAGRVWQLLACGLALKRLRAVDRRMRAATVDERGDIHADLLEGFLNRLATVDTSRPNIAGRLVDAARYNARKARKARRTHLPVEYALHAPDPTATPGTGPHNWTEAVQGMADDFTAAGRRLDPQGLELIARTLLDRQQLTEAAADLGLSVDAAYKRRRRTEEAIAAFYCIAGRRPASGRAKAVRRDPAATAEGA
ncbi:hypothetical protein ACGFIP_04585 [Micromonospora zamorensis]|uniref:Sigma-70 family RNA polymerase sigma factor n=1 Tax=Micromonospora zamorensis TaxID=709883 RepID=A0ABZ1P8F1_9ACTN|nr:MULTISPECIES: hypothetical protein [Micromonospora]WSK48392.1 hypothetical protein OG423_31165 [Micromonospora zamorensis]